MTQEALSLQISAGFGQGVTPSVVKDNVEVEIPPAAIFKFAEFARKQLGADLITAITAVDNGETFELLYHFVSVRPVAPHRVDPAFPGYLLMRVKVPKDVDMPVVPSITPLYPGANQQEREVYDLMGIRFKGHPKLERILLWEGFPGHPLRKDWEPLNVEIPWHLAGMTGFGGDTMADVPAVARIGTDATGFSQPIPMGTTLEAFNRPASRPPKPTEKLHIKIGQGGLTDYETPEGPVDELPPGIDPPKPPHGTIKPPPEKKLTEPEA